MRRKYIHLIGLLLLLAVSVSGASPEGAVNINFPSTGLGALYIVPSADLGNAKGHKMICLAKGQVSVKVPPASDLVLVANPNLRSNPRLLRTLPPEALDGIEIHAVSLDDTEEKLNDELVSEISKLSGLKRLEIPMLGVTDDQISKLKNLKQLRFLGIAASKIKGACFKDLNELPALSKLDVSNNSIKTDYISLLAQCKQLRTVQLNRCNINNEGVKQLAKCAGLTDISLAGNPRGDDLCAEDLARFKNLVCIRLTATGLTLKGLQRLPKNNLKGLIISNNLSRGQLATLKKLFPKTGFELSETATSTNEDQSRIFAPLTN